MRCFPCSGADPGIGGVSVPGFSRKCEVEGYFLEVDGSSYSALGDMGGGGGGGGGTPLQLGVFGDLLQKKVEISRLDPPLVLLE